MHGVIYTSWPWLCQRNRAQGGRGEGRKGGRRRRYMERRNCRRGREKSRGAGRRGGEEGREGGGASVPAQALRGRTQATSAAASSQEKCHGSIPKTSKGEASIPYPDTLQLYCPPQGSNCLQVHPSLLRAQRPGHPENRCNPLDFSMETPFCCPGPIVKQGQARALKPHPKMFHVCHVCSQCPEGDEPR